MAADHRTPAMRHVVQRAYALVTPLGALVFYLFSSGDGAPHPGLGQALGFAAGAFVCIATSDLLPELQFHRHDRAALSAALIGRHRPGLEHRGSRRRTSRTLDERVRVVRRP